MPMVDTFTLSQLVRYTYRECSQEEKQLIDELASSDWDVREEIQMLKEAVQCLPKALFSPKPSTLKWILDYSKQSR